MVQQVVRAVPWWLHRGHGIPARRPARAGRPHRPARPHPSRRQPAGKAAGICSISATMSPSPRTPRSALVELDAGQIVVGPISLGGRHRRYSRRRRRRHAPRGRRMADGTLLARAGRSHPGRRTLGRHPGPPRGAVAARPRHHPERARVFRRGRTACAWSWRAMTIGTLPVLQHRIAGAAGGGISPMRRRPPRAFPLATFAHVPLDPAPDRPGVAGRAAVPGSRGPRRARCSAACRRASSAAGASSYIRVWLKPVIVFGAGEWLSGTLFWPVGCARPA